jgi:tetratricopeptide (TPR) repeat protein
MIDIWYKCLDLYLSFLAADPRGDEELRNVALVHKNLADVLEDPQEALKHALQAEQLDSERVAAQPANVQAQLDLSYDLDQIGNAYLNQGTPKKALERFLRSRDIRRTLSDRDPADMRKRSAVVYAEYRVGDSLLELNNPSEALGHFQRAVAIGTDQFARTPTNPLPQYLAQAYRGLSEASERMGRPTEACFWWRRADSMDPSIIAKKPARLAACQN